MCHLFGCNFVNASGVQVWGKGCKTLFCVLINPSAELSVFWDGKMFRQRGSVVAGFTLHSFK